MRDMKFLPPSMLSTRTFTFVGGTVTCWCSKILQNITFSYLRADLRHLFRRNVNAKNFVTGFAFSFHYDLFWNVSNTMTTRIIIHSHLRDNFLKYKIFRMQTLCNSGVTRS